jgi:hypothetical protein
MIDKYVKKKLMLPLRQRIFPNIDVELDAQEMWICSVIRKKHSDGKYYLTEVKRSVIVQAPYEPVRSRLIHQMVNEFNYMVYMFLVHSPVDPDARNFIGSPIYVQDPDQTDDLERVYRVYN